MYYVSESGETATTQGSGTAVLYRLFRLSKRAMLKFLSTLHSSARALLALSIGALLAVPFMKRSPSEEALVASITSKGFPVRVEFNEELPGNRTVAQPRSASSTSLPALPANSKMLVDSENNSGHPHKAFPSVTNERVAESISSESLSVDQQRVSIQPDMAASDDLPAWVKKPSLLDCLMNEQQYRIEPTILPSAKRPTDFSTWMDEPSSSLEAGAKMTASDPGSPFGAAEPLANSQNSPRTFRALKKQQHLWPDDDPRTAVASTAPVKRVGRDAMIRDWDANPSLGANAISRPVVHRSTGAILSSQTVYADRTTKLHRFGQPPDNTTTTAPQAAPPQSAMFLESSGPTSNSHGLNLDPSIRAASQATIRSQLPEVDKSFIQPPSLP